MTEIGNVSVQNAHEHYSFSIRMAARLSWQLVEGVKAITEVTFVS
jgi:hypothetical protein